MSKTCWHAVATYGGEPADASAQTGFESTLPADFAENAEAPGDLAPPPARLDAVIGLVWDLGAAGTATFALYQAANLIFQGA